MIRIHKYVYVSEVEQLVEAVEYMRSMQGKARSESHRRGGAASASQYQAAADMAEVEVDRLVRKLKSRLSQSN